MSGTSLDGVDAALLRLEPLEDPRSWTLVASWSGPFRLVDVERLRHIAGGGTTDSGELSRLRMQVAREYEAAVREVCELGQQHPQELAYVAAHGVTLWHAPASGGHTWQIHAGQALATWLETVVIDDLRTADVAAGGHGAPLAPICDLRLRSAVDEDRVILNFGGVANLTALPAGARDTTEIRSGDVGPANLLLDGLRRAQTEGREHFDRDGALGSSGRPDLALVDAMLHEGWVRLPLPRSYGREQFSQTYLESFLHRATHLSAADQMATLVAVEAAAVRIFLEELCGDWRRRLDKPLGIYLCGGGRHNQALVDALRLEMPEAKLDGIEVLGIPADFKEAVDWALLGWLTLSAEAGGARPVTGAKRDLVLGALHAPTLLACELRVTAPARPPRPSPSSVCSRWSSLPVPDHRRHGSTASPSLRLARTSPVLLRRGSWVRRTTRPRPGSREATSSGSAYVPASPSCVWSPPLPCGSRT